MSERDDTDRPKWIRFVEVSPGDGRLTKYWQVVSTSKVGAYLGEVHWYGPWRKYSFFPNCGEDLVFEQDCLRDIAAFIETETQAHRAARKAAKR